jgi:DNA-binding transcriptional MerR regulator
VATSTLARWRRDGLITPAEMTAGGQARYRLSELRDEVREIYRRQQDGP